MKKVWFALLAIAVLGSPACTKTDNPIENNDEIMVRFRNTLTTDIQLAQMDVGQGPATVIGLIPAGGGTKEMLIRAADAQAAFETIGFGKVSTSASRALIRS